MPELWVDWIVLIYPSSIPAFFLPNSLDFLPWIFSSSIQPQRRLTPSPVLRVSLSYLKEISSSFPEVDKLSYDPLIPERGFLELL